MKSTVSEQSCVKELPFPKLMVSHVSNVICLFINQTSGFVVGNADSANPIGTFLNGLLPAYWKDFHGSVCLENDK